MKHLQVKNLGPVKLADIGFGDLTVFVGPQATGKSILLQLVKLLVDHGSIVNELRRFNHTWDSPEQFFELYFGGGMSGLFETGRTEIVKDGEAVAPASFQRGNKSASERLFFIPAQRVLSLREGTTRPFSDYRSDDPFVVREFSEKLHQLVQTEFARTADLFPQSRRLKAEFRDKIEEHIFGGFGLKTSTDRLQKRMVLHDPTGKAELPYLVWSAGQREFVPLLLGLYWLMPPTKVSRRGKLKWVVIEELEMGLHPNAISTTVLLVLELVRRGYRVCLSTHSPHVLDVVWALRVMKEQKGKAQDVLDLFDLRSSPPTKALAAAALRADMAVHYFQRDGAVVDISGLDPGAEATAESGWGGLSEFSGRVGEIVSRVVSRAQQGK
ncbi:MAG: hypothetical protein A2289_26995 [Deltaproteobacteria bacterium RIFOXYA12_FULL_58_15]|nr:MAG: hypothetical protein A2289_26995 [Deltaproteobacteria bacterium RIFOXYA12_FULL_58_15]